VECGHLVPIENFERAQQQRDLRAMDGQQFSDKQLSGQNDQGF
jgi:hypothetical protein